MTDQELISTLRNDNSSMNVAAMRQIYKECYPMVEQMIIKNSGSTDDAKDLFQDSLLVFYNKVKSKDFEISSRISTYLYAICRNLWLKKIRDVKDQFSSATDDIQIDSGLDIQKNLEFSEQQKMIGEVLLQSGDTCYKLLKAYYYDKIKMRKIAELFNYASEQVAKNQKLRCMKKVRAILSKNINYKNALSSYLS